MVSSPAILRSLAFADLIFCRSLSLTHKIKSFVPASFAGSTLRLISGMSTSNVERSEIDIGYLNAKDAYNLDAELMSTPGFTLEQLMELAGLAVAQVVFEVSPMPCSKILLVCGPGNNGGDGLVAARHLVQFGHKSIVVYPKHSSKQHHYTNLVKSCEDLGIPVLDVIPEDVSTFDIIVDSIFGFSFSGTPRSPFNTILKDIMEAQREFNIPIVSVDVPSGWNVDEGDVSGLGFLPDVLISLTAPKLCSKTFKGRHFCGGRFLTPALADKYGLRMPPYSGTSQYMELSAICTD